MRTIPKINKGVFMRQAMVIFLALFFLPASGFTQTEIKRWIATSMGSWHDPKNWDPEGVPTHTSHVVINENTPTCTVENESVVFYRLHNLGNLVLRNCTLSGNYFDNDGKVLVSGKAIFLNYGIGYALFEPYEIVNRGTIDGGHIRLKWIEHLENTQTGIIEAKSISIEANTLTNDGIIKGTDGVKDDPDGGQIQAKCGEFSNNGILAGGNGYTIGGRGGSVNIEALRVTNSGILESGRGGNFQPAGDVVITADEINSNGRIAVGEAGYGGFRGFLKIFAKEMLSFYESLPSGSLGKAAKAAADEDYIIYSPDSDVELVADTILVCTKKSRIQVGVSASSNASLYFTGNYLKFADIDTSNAIYSYAAIHFNTTKDGVLDFSGVRTADAFATLHWDYFIHCDNIIEPPEGLENIFYHSKPMTWPVDTTVINGYIGSYSAITDTGDVDTITVSLHNLSMGKQILNYSAHSKLGWTENVTSSTGMLEPLESESFLLPYEVPVDIAETTTDTVTLALSIGETFKDTGYVYITCYMPEETSGINEDPVPAALPEEYRLDVYPNPFNAQVTINYQLPRPEQVRLKIYNLMGQVVKTLMDKKPLTEGSVGSVSWNSRDDAGRMAPSGVYFIRLESQHRQTSMKLLLLK